MPQLTRLMSAASANRKQQRERSDVGAAESFMDKFA